MEKNCMDVDFSDPFFSDVNMERLRQTVADIESGKSTLKEHELIEEEMIRRKTPGICD